MDKTLLEKIKLLDGLQPSAKQLWGKMSAQHMVEHLIFAMQLSNNKLNVGCFNPPEKIPVLKKIMMSSRPFPREFINPVIGENLVPLIHNSLNEAIRNLIREVEDYYKFFEENPDAVLTNPTFGDLGKTEWAVFHEKHFRHHFEQFGLIY